MTEPAHSKEQIKARIDEIVEELLATPRFQRLLKIVANDEYYVQLAEIQDKPVSERIKEAAKDLANNAKGTLYLKAGIFVKNSIWAKEESLTLKSSPQPSPDFFKKELVKETLKQIEQEFPIGPKK